MYLRGPGWQFNTFIQHTCRSLWCERLLTSGLPAETQSFRGNAQEVLTECDYVTRLFYSVLYSYLFSAVERCSESEVNM